MHTYANAGLRLSRAVPQRSLPPCGGGQGEGYNKHSICFALKSNTYSQPRFLGLCTGLSSLLCASSPPLSLSLPHKGGGNAVAPLCSTADQHSRRCACPSACAGTTAESHFAGGSIAALRSSGALAGSAMNLMNAAATSGCFDAVSTPAPTRPYSISSSGSGPRYSVPA